jgi:crossover junction endodeoxyribonuclease RuvC
MTDRTSAFMVVGLDLSLTATGIARVGTVSEPEGVFTIKSKGKKTDTVADRAQRLNDLDHSIRVMIPSGATVVVESPAYNQTGGSHHDRSGLWWLVVSSLVAQRYRVIEVPPQLVKKYATGKGNASKMEVMAQAIRRYGGFGIDNDNEADALVLAMIGRRLIGSPRDDVPKINLSALDSLASQGGTR